MVGPKGVQGCPEVCATPQGRLLCEQLPARALLSPGPGPHAKLS